ncbi:MAG TPA: hypothetical protein VEF04_20045 [Blastocatellia bacterium]|nr:hypothetical protein [Blastocatellia bacterium]
MPKSKNYEALIALVTPDIIDAVIKWQLTDNLTAREALDINAQELDAQKQFIDRVLAEKNPDATPDGVILADQSST